MCHPPSSKLLAEEVCVNCGQAAVPRRCHHSSAQHSPSRLSSTAARFPYLWLGWKEGMDPYSSPYITYYGSFHFLSIRSFPANQRPVSGQPHASAATAAAV